MPRRRRDSPLREVNLLDLAPARTADWAEREGRVVVERPRPEKRIGAALEWVSWFLSVRRIRLDAFGSHAWKRFDGERRVAEVAVELRGEFGEVVEPVEERLGEFVRRLRREGLLAYPEWDGSGG